MHKPKPIDTSKVKLSKEIVKLSEVLAMNAHDVWGKQRMSEGWTWGQNRNDTAKSIQILCLMNNFLSLKRNMADKAALRHQKYHRWLTIFAAGFGTIAILSAIIYLSKFFPTPWPMWVEALAAVMALAAVLLGLIHARQAQWLLHRHKAELCRLLKLRTEA